MIVGRAAFDWLTITTYQIEPYVDAMRCLHIVGDDKPVPSQTMQYKGMYTKHYFYGEGEQAGEKHYYVRVSGALAQHFVDLAHPQGWLGAFRPSRADLQITGTMPADVDLPALARWLREQPIEDWRATGGARPRVDCRDNEDKLDTIYIGGRSSRRMQRIYVKPVIGQRLLRWEVEYKKELARQVYEQMVRHGTGVLAAFMAGEMDAVPLVRMSGFDALRLMLQDDGVKPSLAYEAPDDDTTLKWLHDAVRPAIIRLLKGPRKAEAQQWLADMVYRAADVEKGDI